MFSGDYGFFDYKYNISGYTGQDFGGSAQYVYLIASAMLLTVLLALLRRSGRERIRGIVRFIGVFLTVFYLGKTVWESVYDIRLGGAFNIYLLPLDTCSIVMPAALLAGFGRGKAQQYAECWLSTGGIVGGIGAMIYLNAFKYYPFFSFGAFYSMLWHLLMVFLGLLLIVTGVVELKYISIKRGFLLHVLVSAVVIPADFLFGLDFMMYRELGGIPFFEDVAAGLTEAGLAFLNPLLMLSLYLIAFCIVIYVSRGIKALFSRRLRHTEESCV